MPKTMRTFLHPKRPEAERAPGAIVAKDTTPAVDSILVVGDTLVVSQKDPMSAKAPGVVTVRRRDDYTVIRSAKGSSGGVTPFGDVWLAEGPYVNGDRASTAVLDPKTLKCIARHPVRGPFLVRDEHRFVATTPRQRYGAPTFVSDPKIERGSWVKLPSAVGIVELDTKKEKTELLLAAKPTDDFHHAAIAPDRAIVYAATDFGRVVALRLADKKVLWERPPVSNVVEWSGKALALAPKGDFLAIAGSSSRGFDTYVLDTRTGKVEAQIRLAAMIDEARIAKKPTTRIDALAFHPAGWLAAGTNTGVVVEMTSTGRISAFAGATRAIRALTFADDKTLIVGGAEPNLRVWPVDLDAGPRVQIRTIDDPKARRRTRVITTE